MAHLPWLAQDLSTIGFEFYYRRTGHVAAVEVDLSNLDILLIEVIDQFRSASLSGRFADVAAPARIA